MTDPTSLPNFPPPADEHPLRGRVLDILTDLGISPTIDDDGDVAFIVGEPPQQMFVRCQDGDLPIMRVFGQWQISEPAPEDLLERLARCNDFTLQYNVAKAAISGGNLVVTCDHIVMPEVDLATLFKVSVDVVLQVVQQWFQSFQPGDPDGDPQPGQEQS